MPEELVEPIEVVAQEYFAEIGVRSRVFLRSEVASFQREIERVQGEGYFHFLVNFKSCEYISSEGLGCIAEFWRKCKESGEKKLAFLFENKDVNNLLSSFEVIGLAKVMDGHIFMDYEKAIHFFSNPSDLEKA